MTKLEKGYFQVYTGNGKGKTTASIGQGVRAVGNGLSVYMIQFLKGGFSGELEAIKKLEPQFKIYRFEKERGFFWTLNEEEKIELKNEIKNAYNFCIEVMKNRKCDMLILDEIIGAFHNKLLSLEELAKLVDSKPNDMELIMTGRNVPEEIANKANLITEMREIKHYFNEGISSRKGIEY